MFSWLFYNCMQPSKVRAVAVVFHFQDLSSLCDLFWNNGMPAKCINHYGFQQKEIHEKLIEEGNIMWTGLNLLWIATWKEMQWINLLQVLWRQKKLCFSCSSWHVQDAKQYSTMTRYCAFQFKHASWLPS